jgi:hypothetical protein
VTTSILSHSRSLYIITQASAGSHDSDRPSWVPDWSVPGMFYNPDWIIHGNYNAARNNEAVYEILGDNKELRVMGKRVDCVENIPLANLTAYQQEETVSNRIPGWKKSCGVGFSLSKYPTGESVQEAVWRTLSWNTDDGDGYPARVDHGKYFEVVPHSHVRQRFRKHCYRSE